MQHREEATHIKLKKLLEGETHTHTNKESPVLVMDNGKATENCHNRIYTEDANKSNRASNLLFKPKFQKRKKKVDHSQPLKL